MHNITAHLTPRGMWIDLDLEVEPAATFERAHTLATELETRLRAELAQDESRVADIHVHIEPRTEGLKMGKELTPKEAARYVERIQAITKAVPHTRGCHGIEVQRIHEHVYLAFHLLVEADLTIAHVHSVAEEMENRLRREFPELGRVVVHTEPEKSANLGK